MAKLTDEQLQQRIQKRKEELDALLAMEQERIQARRGQIGAYLEDNYGITTIPELEELLSQLPKEEEV